MGSKWSWVIHFWAGLCIKMIVDELGVVENYLPLLNPMSPKESAKYAGAHAALTAIEFAFGYAVSWSIYKWIGCLQVSKRLTLLLKISVPFAYLVILIFCLQSISPRSVPQHTPITNVANVADSSVSVSVATEKIDGLTESDFTPDKLPGLEAMMIEHFLFDLKKRFLKDGGKIENFKPQLNVHSEITKLLSRKLVKIEIDLGQVVSVVIVLFVKNETLHRITCKRDGNRSVPITEGACFLRIKELLVNT